MNRRLIAAAAAVVVAAVAAPAPARAAPQLVPINGSGSTWSGNAIDNWRRNILQRGVYVNYAPTGSTDGRRQFANHTVDFGVSEIPYGMPDKFAGADARPPNVAYMPIVAGGTAFMYNLKIGGRRVTNLRLSGDVIARIFTRRITRWNDPAIRADNPGLNLPARQIVPVIRTDGSGTTAQFTLWLSKRHPAIWNAYCARFGKSAPCGATSFYPLGSGMVGQSLSTGVAGYVAQNNAEGAINYVEYSYAINQRFPVIKVLNQAGYYVEPTASNVAVALTQAGINTNQSSPNYLTQQLDRVYAYNDRRAYPLSSYSYMLIPLPATSGFNITEDKGYTLARFANYFLCEGQQQAEVLGYSPLPVNLVRAGMDQVRRVRGAPSTQIRIETCNNPTFSRDGTNTLARTAPQPSACDRRGPTQNPAGTAGARQDTPVLASARCSGGGNTSGGNNNAGGNNGGNNAGATPGATAGPSQAAAVDPDTGELIGGPADGQGGDQIVAQPVTLEGEGGWRLRHTLMALAGLLLLLVTVAPPLLATAMRAGRDRGREDR